MERMDASQRRQYLMVLHPQGDTEKRGVIQMTLEEVVSRMSGPDRLHIETEDKEVIYNGYQGNLQFHEINKDAEVVKIGLHMNVFRKSLRNEVLASTEGGVPLPDYITDIPYGDLEHCIYQKIVIKK